MLDQSVLVADLTRQLSAANAGTNILVFDSCRDVSGTSDASAADSVATKPHLSQGLRCMTKLEGDGDSLIVYSCAWGKVAIDGCFTPRFLKILKEFPGDSFSEVFTEVRRKVIHDSKNQQVF